MCDALSNAFQTSPVELRQWVNYIDVLEPQIGVNGNTAIPFDVNLGVTDSVKGYQYTVYGIRLRGTLTCPTVARYTNHTIYATPEPYKCRIIVGCDMQPQNSGDPFFAADDGNSLPELINMDHPPSSWPVANRRVNSYKRFVVLADKLFVFNPHVVVYKNQLDGTATAGPNLLAFNHTDGDGDKSSRFVHDTDGSVIGAGVFPIGGLSTVGTVEGPGVGVNALDATTTDPDRDVEVAGVVTGEPFAVTGTFNIDGDLAPTTPSWIYPVTQKFDFDIPLPRPVDVPIAPQGFRCALSNRFVFWIVSDFLTPTPTPDEHAYKFRFQGFSELLFTDY